MWWSIRIFFLVVLSVGMAGCKTPFDPVELQSVSGQEISIQYLKSFYSNAPLFISDDYVIRGTVISSDAQGNFRWTLVIEDATGGIELKVGLSPYYERFAVGQEVRVKCAGLVLGSYGRTIQLGASSDSGGYETGFIASERVGEHVVPTGRSLLVTPRLLSPQEFSMRYVNCAVYVDGVRFIEEEQGLTWSDGDGYTERHLVWMDNPVDTLIVRTSPTAVFGMEELPSGVGSLEGILTQFAGIYSLVINSVQGL